LASGASHFGFLLVDRALIGFAGWVCCNIVEDENRYS
jgi:hypothetical protein